LAAADGVDARRSADVASAVRTWLERRYSAPVHEVEPPRSNGAGRATLIHLVRFAGPNLPSEWAEPLVVRIHQSVREAEASAREAAIQDWCADRGYPAPRVLALFAPGELLSLPVQVMERARGVAMLDAVKHAPWLAPRMIDQLGALQRRLHELPVDGWPEGGAPRLAERRLGLVRRVVATTQDPELTEALQRVEHLLPSLATGPVVPCHGDFHPLNVLVAGRTTTVIDWTDAALGDRHGDIARTAWLLRTGGGRPERGRIQRAALSAALARLADRYVRAEHRARPLDPVRVRQWEALHVLHAWADAKGSEDESTLLPALQASFATVIA
jgi:aminoglycoside phosphotransferase (APT) family kinase protein